MLTLMVRATLSMGDITVTTMGTAFPQLTTDVALSSFVTTGTPRRPQWLL